jgi:hypothetical protein
MTVETLGAAIAFLGLAAVIAVAGIVVGMLIAPRLARLAEPRDEEPGGDDD